MFGKAADFAVRTLLGTMTAGAVMAASWAVAKCAFNATPGDDALPETILAAAGLGVASAMMTDDIGDAAMRGMQFGGAATAAFVLTGGKEGVLLEHAKGGYAWAQGEVGKGITLGQQTFNGWVRDPACDLLENGPQFVHCNREEVEQPCPDGKTCFTADELQAKLNDDYAARTKDMFVLTADELQDTCLDHENLWCWKESEFPADAVCEDGKEPKYVVSSECHLIDDTIDL